MEADFQRFYQMDLNRKVFRDRMSSRRLFVLMKGLPAESNFMQFLADKDKYSLATYNPNNIKI